MWLAPDDDAILFATGGRSRKARNLRRDPRATVVLHDSRPGFEVCGVSIRGTVEIVEGERAEPLVARVHGRYLEHGSDIVPEARAFLESDDVALRLVPVSAVTWDERVSRAAQALRLAGGALPLEPTSPRAPSP